jgi:hypothetical protein
MTIPKIPESVRYPSRATFVAIQCVLWAVAAVVGVLATQAIVH